MADFDALEQESADVARRCVQEFEDVLNFTDPVEATQAKNAGLRRAKVAKQDEFYTRLTDIEKELKYYRKHFKNKMVYCNCDDPAISNFFYYFGCNFEKLGLKELITICYKSQQIDTFSQNDSEHAISLQYFGNKGDNTILDANDYIFKDLDGDGDFRSAESVELLKRADIVVTNPPFSLFREYVAQLIEHEKKFLILGNQNAVTYKEIFPLIQDNKLWLGHNNGQMTFKVPDHYEPRETGYWQDKDEQKWRSFGNICWFTNLEFPQRHEDFILYKKYTPEDYPIFDHYDAINVNKIADIPDHYDGPMGVPITFLTKYNPDQFEIVDANTIRRSVSVPVKPHGLIKDKDSAIDGKPTYVRIVIKRRQMI